MAGNNIVSINRVGKAQVVFKVVALRRGVMDYRNNVFLARNVGWRIIGRPRKDDFAIRNLKAAVAMTAEVRESVCRLAGVLNSTQPQSTPRHDPTD